MGEIAHKTCTCSELVLMNLSKRLSTGWRRTCRYAATASLLLVLGACAGQASGAATTNASVADQSVIDTAPNEQDFEPTVVFQWNRMSLAAVRHEVNPAPPAVARSLFIVHSAMYDAWAAYSPEAIGTVTGQELDVQGTDEDRATAVSVAAYWAILDQFPDFDVDTNAPVTLLRQLVGEPNANPAAGSPEAIGLAAATAITEDRQDDGANESGGYAEPASYSYPQWGEGSDPGLTDWTPLKVPTGELRDERGAPIVDLEDPDSFEGQVYIGPHWGDVRPFAMPSGDAVRPQEPPRPGSEAAYSDALGHTSTSDEAFRSQFREVLEFSATLTDEHKLLAEYWADGPRSETPPGHWNLLAQGVSFRDDHNLEDDIKMFFALNASLHDAGIAAWDAKRAYTSARPVTVIPKLFAGENILAWAGPNQGTAFIDPKDWAPYQKATFVTPGFPEYVSGHSAFSAAAAGVLTMFTNSDRFYDGDTLLPWDHDGDGEADQLGEFVFRPGSGVFERMPEQTVRVEWPTFADAADSAGISRLYGGIHIQDGDLFAREMGREVAEMTWTEVNRLWAS